MNVRSLFFWNFIFVCLDLRQGGEIVESLLFFSKKLFSDMNTLSRDLAVIIFRIFPWCLTLEISCYGKEAMER